MKKPSIPLGLVFSQSGPYAMMAGEMRKSALMAIDEINQSDQFDFVFAPHLRDPGGVVAAYHTACEGLIREENVDHIVGCYTSASRKQVIPIVERTERLLWHPARYEGFESSENVIYVGAAPNQHVVPLVRHMLDHISSDVFCTGSNYVWTWETNRVIREIVTSGGGRMLAEARREGAAALKHLLGAANIGADVAWRALRSGSKVAARRAASAGREAGTGVSQEASTRVQLMGVGRGTPATAGRLPAASLNSRSPCWSNRTASVSANSSSSPCMPGSVASRSVSPAPIRPPPASEAVMSTPPSMMPGTPPPG